MDILQQQYFKNSVQEWLLAVGIFLVGYLGLRAIKRVSVKKLRKLAEKTSVEWDDFLVDLLSSTKSFFFFFLALLIGASYLTLPPLGWKILKSLFVVSALFQALLWGQGIIEFVLESYLARRQATRGIDPSLKTTYAALRFLLRFILYSIIALLVLDNLGFNVTALITGLGVGGIAVALATQNILGDLFASLSIVLDKPFVVGDFIEIGANKGTVQNIGLKSTRLLGVNGEQVIVSNNELLKSRIHNFGRIQKRRIVQTLGLTYDISSENLKAVPSILESVVKSSPKGTFDRAHFKSFGDSSINFEFVYFVESGDHADYVKLEEAVNLKIFEEFKKRKINFAFPTRTIIMQQELPNDQNG